MVGTTAKMIRHILENKNKVDYDLINGVVTTLKGTNGSVCKSTGYLVFKLNGTKVQVHSFLIAVAYGRELEGMTVNHKDGNKLNNRLDNLEIVTHSENVKHQWATGLASWNGGSAKLTKQQADYIRDNFVPNKKRGENTIGFFAEKFNVSKSTIRNVTLGTYY